MEIGGEGRGQGGEEGGVGKGGKGEEGEAKGRGRRRRSAWGQVNVAEG